MIAEAACCCDETDREWGRIVGAAPPLSPWAPVVWFTATALLLIAVVVAVITPPGPQDDPRPADQRAGFLIDGPQLRLDVPGLAIGERPIVLIFDRAEPAADRLRAWLTRVPARASAALVLPGPGRAEVSVLADPAGDIARAVGMAAPKDGAPPIGYAVIDSTGRVRYATLDPTYLDNAFEIAVIAGAVE